MTNPTPHGQVPEALRLAALLDADEWPGNMSLVSYARACVAELLRLHAENQVLRTTHVQSPTENEHVAGDVSKNGVKLNVSTQQKAAEASRFGSPELQAMIVARCVAKDQADSVREDAARYRMVRRGQRWSVVDGIGNDLRAEALDSAIDAARAARAPADSVTAPTPVLHLVHSAFAEIAMAFPKAFALHKVGIADTAVREALAALKDCLEDTCGSGDSRALCKQPLPAPLADRQPAPAKLVEAVTKAILFEDTGSIEGWEENTNLGEAAIRVCDARNPPRCSYCHSATGAPLAAPPTDSVTAR